MTGEKPIEIAGQHFVMNTFRSLYWKQQQALLIADLHCGKSGHFRKHGIAIPGQYLADDLQRLSHLIQYYNARHVYILGDLIHADQNNELLFFAHWLQQYPDIVFHLIPGNHDWKTATWLSTLSLKIHPWELLIENCLLTHIPKLSGTHLVISGHIHPGISLSNYSKIKVKTPAFLISEHQVVLPAFSAFTGLDTLYATRQIFDCYAVTDTAIISL